MATAAPPYFRLYAPGFARSGRIDDGFLPIITRDGFSMQHVMRIGPSAVVGDRLSSQIVFTNHGLLNVNGEDALPVDLPTGSLEVVSTVFEDQSASILVGPYELVSKRDFVVVGGAAAIATSIATAISNLPGYSATPAGTVVNVTGPAGRVYDELRFQAFYRGGEINFTFTWPEEVGALGYASNPPYDPPEEF